MNTVYAVYDPMDKRNTPEKVFNTREEAVAFVATLCDVAYLVVREESL